MDPTGKFEKMNIQAYSDENFKTKAGAPFEVMINPETYSHTYSINYTDKEKLSFKIVLDSTGVVPLSDANKRKDVEQMIKDLKGIVYDYHGSIHQPYYVELLWGAMLFKGRLDNFTIEYKMFKSNGAPLRANVSLSFIGYISEEMAAAQANQNSPDMTHIVTIREGDTLVELCRRIYGKSKYYLKVAEHNKLTNFRSLNPGSRISFPPIK